MIFFGIIWVQLAGTVCPRCYRRSKKASKKALAHPKDHLEQSLRPIQATQVTLGHFGPEKIDLKTFGLQMKTLRLETYFPLKEPQNSLSLWNGSVR